MMTTLELAKRYLHSDVVKEQKQHFHDLLECMTEDQTRGNRGNDDEGTETQERTMVSAAYERE